MDFDFLTGSYKSLYEKYKRNAFSRGKSFKLTHKKFLEVITSNCFWCGIAPFQKHNKIKYMGIDRSDSSKGYSDNNVMPCCKHCNYAKREMSFQEFDNWINRISEHHLFLLKMKENYDESLMKVKFNRRFEELQQKVASIACTSAVDKNPIKCNSDNVKNARSLNSVRDVRGI